VELRFGGVVGEDLVFVCLVAEESLGPKKETIIKASSSSSLLSSSESTSTGGTNFGGNLGG
jgi:hypothetical protein